MHPAIGYILDSRSGRKFKVTGIVLEKGRIIEYEILDLKNLKTTDISREDMMEYIQTNKLR